MNYILKGKVLKGEKGDSYLFINHSFGNFDSTYCILTQVIMPEIKIIKKSCEPQIDFHETNYACDPINSAEEVEGYVPQDVLKILKKGRARSIAYQALLEKLYNQITQEA